MNLNSGLKIEKLYKKARFNIYLISTAPATSAGMKKGEFAKTPLIKITSKLFNMK